MAHVFSVTGTIFLVITFGFVCVTMGIFSKNSLRALGDFVVKIALPALILKALSSQQISDVLNFGYLAAYLLGSIMVLIAGFFVAGLLNPKNATARAFDTAGMACANSGFVGYPILLLALPAIAPTALALNMMVENLIIIPLVILMAELAAGKNEGSVVASKIFHRMITNPNVMAIIAGVGFVLLELQLTTPVSNAIDLIAASSIAVSLFVIGGTIAGVSLAKIGIRVVAIVFGKLFCLPLAVWVCLEFMGTIGLGVENETLRTGAIIMAASPAMSLYPLLAQQYGEEDTAAVAMFVMTILSFFTLSALLYFV